MGKQITSGGAGRRPGGTASVLAGLAGCAAIVVGYFLPWSSLTPTIEGAVGLTRQQVSREADRAGEPGDEESRGAAAARRLGSGAAISGAGWAALLDAADEDESLTDRQRRVLETAGAGVAVLPYAAGAMAALLLLLSVPAGRALRVGAGPGAAVFAVAQLRAVAAVLLVLVMALGIVVCAVSVLLWTGAARAGEDGAQLGAGVQLMGGGGAIACLSVFLGYGRGRLRALLFALIVLAALAGLVAYRLRS